MDYGDTACLSLSNIKELTPEMATIPLQAVQVSLANVSGFTVFHLHGHLKIFRESYGLSQPEFAYMEMLKSCAVRVWAQLFAFVHY